MHQVIEALHFCLSSPWAGMRSQGTGKHPGIIAKDVKSLGLQLCGVTTGTLDCSLLHCYMREKLALLLKLF